MARRHVAVTSLGVALVALLFAARSLAQTSDEGALDAYSWEARAALTRPALLAAGDADSLEAAALLTPKNSAERLQLVLWAVAAAPARTDLAWLALASCIAVESCDVTPLEARLRAADPGNGAAWMGTVARAPAGSPQLNAGIAGIAGSERFDIYWNPLLVHTADALKRTKTMEDHEALGLALGLGSALAIPALQPMSRACKDAPVARPEDVSACRKLSTVLRHGDTYIVESLGLSMAQRLWPASSEEYRRATDEKRVLWYRIHKEGELSRDATSDEAANRYLGRLAAHRTEQEALVAEFVAGGLSPNPPAGWVEPAFLRRAAD